jgi:hypothetical protein
MGKEKEFINCICPNCGGSVETHRCKFCGAEKSINQVSGNEIWFLGGRVISAFADSKIAYIKMATKYNIPVDQWPVEYKEKE